MLEDNCHSIHLSSPLEHSSVFGTRSGRFRALIEEDRSARLLECVVDLILLEEDLRGIAIVPVECGMVDGLRKVFAGRRTFRWVARVADLPYRAFGRCSWWFRAEGLCRAERDRGTEERKDESAD